MVMSLSFRIMPEPLIEVAPEIEQAVNYQAFKEDTHYLRLFPDDILPRLKDEESVENRKTALTIIHQRILDCQEIEIITENLQKIVIMVTMPLSDTNIKIVLTGLQVIHDLISKVQDKITPHLEHVFAVYLEKIGTNKYNVKQAGLKLLMHLTSVVGPNKVIELIMKHGLSSKKSKVREETLNTIAVTVLNYPHSQFDLSTMIKNITPLLADSKQNVRQSCLEMCMILGKHLGDDNIQELLTTVMAVDQTIPRSSSTPSLMLAFEARLSRNLYPFLNSDGLVEHVVSVANGKNSGVYEGHDVDWILAGSGKCNSPRSGIGGRKISGSGPLRSAGKKLPWDSKEKSIKPEEQQPLFHQQQPIGYSSIHQQHVKPLPTLPNTSPRAKGYLDMYQNRSMVRSSMSTETTFKQVIPNTHSADTVQKDSDKADMDVFATTWPRSNGYYNSFIKTTSRQISADTAPLPAAAIIQSSQMMLKSNTSTLPAIGCRPSSKPLVRNLFPPLTPSNPPDDVPLSANNTTPFQIERRFLSGQFEEYDDHEYYYNIPADDSLLNSSLSSSVSSLCTTRDLHSSQSRKKVESNAGDAFSQVRVKAKTWKTDNNTTPLVTTPLVTTAPPLSHGPSPQKKQPPKNKPKINTVIVPDTTKIKSPDNLKHHHTSPPQLNSYSRKYQQQQQQTGMLQPEEEQDIATILNTTYTISPTTTIINDSNPRHDAIPKSESKPNSYAEVAALRKLRTSPQHESFPRKSTKQFNNFTSTHDNDVQLSTETSPIRATRPTMTDTPTLPLALQKSKKLQSPLKNVTAPLQTGRQNLSPINNNVACNSAPVYRIAPDTSTSSTDNDDTLVELEPHPYPERAIKELFEDLESESGEWEKKCNGLLTIRRLAGYNKEIVLAQLQPVVLVVNKEVKNLRSQVARSAIACLGDLFGFLGRDMEQFLDMIVKTLLQVGSKSNTFFREDVEKAISEIISCTSPVRCVLSFLNGGMGHSNNTVRRLMAQCLCCMVEHHGPEKLLKQLPREVTERYLSAIVSLLTDADVGTRYHAKRSVNEFCSYPEFEAIVTKFLLKPQFVKIKETIETLRTKGLGKPPPELISARSTRQSVNRSVTAPLSGPSPQTRQEGINYGSRVRKRRVSATILDAGRGTAHPRPTSNTEIPLPEGILGRMKENDWNERNQAITELEVFIMTHPGGLGSNIVKVFDIFNQRLTDQNSKVNLHALESFQRFVPVIGYQLQPVLSTLIEALVRTVASRYPTIHSAAINAMETLIGSIDHSLLLTPLSSAAQNGNTRVQPFMLRKLAEMLPDVHQQKPSLVQRVGLSLLFKVLSSRSPATGEAKSALQSLCRSLLACLGPEKLELSMTQQPPDQQQRLRDILRNL